MARQTQWRRQLEALIRLFAGALAEFVESAHIKRDLMGKFDRVFAFRLFELEKIAANGMFTRGAALLRLPAFHKGATAAQKPD